MLITPAALPAIRHFRHYLSRHGASPAHADTPDIFYCRRHIFAPLMLATASLRYLPRFDASFITLWLFAMLRAKAPLSRSAIYLIDFFATAASPAIRY